MEAYRVETFQDTDLTDELNRFWDMGWKVDKVVPIYPDKDMPGYVEVTVIFINRALTSTPLI